MTWAKRTHHVRSRPVKTQRPKNFRMPMSGEDPDEPMLSPEERWIKSTVVEFWMRVDEVVKPGGTDAFGRVKDLATPAERQINFNAKPGAVWISKDMFRSAWFETFGSSTYDADGLYLTQRPSIDSPRFVPNDAKADAEMQRTHPVDAILRELVQQGKLTRNRKDQYWLTGTLIERLGLQEADKLHYARMIRRDKNPQRHRNPNHVRWTEVLLALRDHVVFDKETVRRLAIDAGLDVNDTTISSHIHSWQNPGPRQHKEIDRVGPGLYRTIRSRLTNAAGEWDGHRPLMPVLTDWMWQFIALWSPFQRANRTGAFGWEDVLETLEQDWLDENEPDGLFKERIMERIARFTLVSRRKEDEAIFERGYMRGTYRVTQRVLDAFDEKEPAIKFTKRLSALILREFTLLGHHSEPFWFIPEDVTAHWPDYAYATVMDALRDLFDAGMVAPAGWLLPDIDVYALHRGKLPIDAIAHPLHVMTLKAYAEFGLHSTFSEPVVLTRDRDGFPIRFPVPWQKAIQSAFDKARTRFTLEFN